jgi:hypothetical protein
MSSAMTDSTLDRVEIDNYEVTLRVRREELDEFLYKAQFAVEVSICDMYHMPTVYFHSIEDVMDFWRRVQKRLAAGKLPIEVSWFREANGGDTQFQQFRSISVDAVWLRSLLKESRLSVAFAPNFVHRH